MRTCSIPCLSAARLLGLCGVLLIAGCYDNADMIEMQNYVNGVVNRPPGVIEPPPQFLSYEPFTYSAASLRGPFDVPVDTTNAMRNQQIDEVRPDETRAREYLEDFAIGNLVMVGTLSRNGERWALIRDEVSGINRVAVGNYMGRNHGRIAAITDLQVDVIEIVPTGDGRWIERPQSIPLQGRATPQ